MNLPKKHDFLEVFFGNSNQLKWEEIITNRLPKVSTDKFIPWVNSYLSGSKTIVIPRVYEDGDVYWYAMASDSKKFSELRELLHGAVGCSYSNFNGIPYILDLSDPIENAIRCYFGNLVFRFTTNSSPSTSSDKNEIVESLQLMHQQSLNKPSRANKLKRDRGLILGDITSALYLKDSTKALSYLGELRSSGGVGYQNELFIEIRAFDCSNQWDKIFKHNDFPQLVDLPRPALVTEALLKAIYNHLFLSYELNNDLNGQIEAFKLFAKQGNQGLFSVFKSIKSASALKMWLLWFLLEGSNDSKKTSELIQSVRSLNDNDHVWINKLLPSNDPNNAFEAPIKAPIELDPLENNNLINIAESEPFQFLTNLINESVNIEVASISLKCAWLVGTIDAAVLCINFLKRFENTELSKLLKNAVFLKYYTEIKNLIPKDGLNISNWNDWIKKIIEDISWTSCISVAEEGSTTWSEESFDLALFCNQVSEIINLKSELASKNFRATVPYILNWIDECESEVGYKELWSSIIEFLALDDLNSKEDIFLAQEILPRFLNCAITSIEYKEVLECIDILLDSTGAENIDQRIDVLELLVINNCYNHESRSSLLNKTYNMLCINPTRYQTHEWNLFLLIAEEGDVQFDLPNVITENLKTEQDTLSYLIDLNTYKIGIYTLTESVGLRVKKELKELFPKINVQLNSDKTSTTSLVSLAKNADLFIFSWRSASHSAYDAIKAARGKLPLIQPEGKGSSSMLKAILDYK